MGVDLGELIVSRKISLEELSGKAIAVDAYNTLYQFLAIIRQPDGKPLMDRHGRVTSHLSGLLYRTSNLIEKGIKLVYVFDGKPPALKEMEIKRRMKVKVEAALKYEEALKEGRLEEARRYAQATSQLSDEMVADAKRLLDALGIPWVQAPSEGEAQAAHMVMRNDAWSVASQDHDALLFGAPRVTRNLTITGRRKLPRKDVYIQVEPELVDLSQTLKELGITREQLVDIAILIGTDFNPDGVKGVGPKSALRLIKEYVSLGHVVENVKAVAEALPSEWQSIREIFLKPVVTDDYRLEWRRPRMGEVVEFLCHERDFSEDRVRKAVEKIDSSIRALEAKAKLEAFFTQA